MIKGTIHQKSVTVLNIYILNICAPNFMKQAILDINAQSNLSTIIVNNFSTPFSSIDMSFRQNK